MTPYQIEQLKISARADYARSRDLQNEFSTPEEFACYRVAKERGLIQCAERVETDPARAEFRRIWDAMPAFQAQWRGGFEEAWRQHLIQESARCAPGLHGAKPTIYARLSQ